MTVVLVHGIPETPEIWEPLRTELRQPTRALALPGIATTTPEGWTGTKEELAGWLDDELGHIHPPIDVVGHDVGALLVMRLVTAGRTPVRSWVVDVPGLFAPEARFSGFAQRLQEEAGWRARLGHRTSLPASDAGSWAGVLRSSGVPDRLAARIAAQHDADTDFAISAFYRSATPNVAADWWPDDTTAARGRGLVLLLPDPPEIQEQSHRVARRLDAASAVLHSTHCWMAADPRPAADILESFWRDLPATTRK